MTKDELVISRIEDLMDRCRDGYYVTATGFLDSHEQALARQAARNAAGIRSVLYGGYPDAERRLMVFIPADIPMTDEDAVDGLLTVVRISKPAISRDLSHRDYLGSMLGLGIDRSVTGDILVRDDGADIIVLPDISGFLIEEYREVGRTHIRTEEVGIADLKIPKMHTELIRDTVPSVRLDNIVSSAFKISRSKAADAIRGGIVSVDHIECLKPDAKIEEGSAIVLRGRGKAVLREIGGESKKGRLWIRIERFV